MNSEERRAYDRARFRRKKNDAAAETRGQRSESYRATNRERMRTLRERWKECGCCIECGVPVTKYVRCFKHRKRIADLTRDYRYRAKRASHADASRILSTVPIGEEQRHLSSVQTAST